MIEALSGRLAAGINVLSYKGQNGDPRSPQTPPSLGSDPAVKLSLSSEALDRLKQARDSEADLESKSLAMQEGFDQRQTAMRDQLAKRLGFTFREGESMQDGLKRYSDIKHTEGDISQLEAKLGMRDAMAKHLDSMRASYQKMASTPPKAAVALNAQEITEVVKKAKALGLDPLGAHFGDNYSFGIEGKIYTFNKDGTATVHEAGVATSKEQQQQALQSMADFIARATDPMHDVTAQRDALIAKRDALMAA
jgi:hypothetical protein